MQTEACEKKRQDQGKSDVFLISALFLCFHLTLTFTVFQLAHILLLFDEKYKKQCALNG